MAKITIIGGGIAGIEAAIFCKKEGFDVELISERAYLFVYPIAIWIPVSTLSFDDATMSLDALAHKHGFSLVVDRVINVDVTTRSIVLEEGGVKNVEHLIVATGSGKMKHPGIEHTLSICGNPSDALELQKRIDALIAKGSGKIAFGFGGNPNDSSAVRGGPGFELFFNLHHKLKKLGIRQNYEMTFFAPMPQPGARMGDKALKMMQTLFDANKFHTRYGKKIKRFESDKVIFEDDSIVESDLIMYIPAGNGSDLMAKSNLPTNPAGFIRIDSTCKIEGCATWYAIGDAAALEGPDWKAKQGHIAEVMARIAAHNLATDLLNKAGEKHTYFEHLNILCVMDMGNGAGFVYRDDVKAYLIPLPIIGHWLKQLWGHYYKASKMGRFPRLPGL